MNARIQARVELEQDIQGALANGEFEVFYQLLPGSRATRASAS